MPFIHDDFLLTGAVARRLYHDFAAPQPILDYHSHLPPKDIAQNRQFANLFEIWLEGDHYKWRAMRANGVEERYCTGDASPYEKFLAFARTVPYTVRNPLYHWTHLELKRYFGIDDLLDESTAPRVWDRANEQLPHLRVWDIFGKFEVRAVCTTDDPFEDLNWHREIAASACPAKVFPTFRPDKVFRLPDPASHADRLKQRHADFHAMGGRLSDHGLTACPTEGVELDLMLEFGRWDAAAGWTKQLHLGARRNNNARAFSTLGPDTGFDSMGDYRQADALCNYLDLLDRDDALPRTIVYNNNPVDNYAFATAIGNFQGGGIPGKVQFGSGWWFLDQKEGMEMQMSALANCGLLARFVGMLTDSRSFLSFPRHEYFRRTLCNWLGRDVENGEVPESLAGPMVAAICYSNARDYLRLPDVK
ncbi:MAG: glucuronate isomerase [Bryobacteraceae bacterium]|nr:glucuronate isomerase [Bryobacteraceae bacterium]